LEEGVGIMIVFILGLPGSGKTSAARYIKTYVPKHSNGWSTERKNDYTILKRMCDVEKDARLRPTEYDGFDILDLRAFNSALKRLNSEVLEEYEGSGSTNTLTTIEFSRNDYSIALEEFFLEFLTKFHKSTYFLFIETDISVCKERIQKRISKPLHYRSVDDHPVSEFIFETYYKRDDQHYCNSVVKRLQERFYIPDSHIQVIHNSVLAEKDFQEKVGMFVEGILSEEIIATSSTLPQFHEEKLEQHDAENESGTEIQASSTEVLAEALVALL
jgi:thymidylate kinase